MKLPLPDFQKDIKVGDLSFVYNGVYHPIHWEGDIPYRPRVENIVVKNGREIFLRVYDNPKPGFEYRYRLPGGSLDNDSTKIQQAENETNEEALLKVKNIQYSGIKYFEQFPEGHLLKDGDICLEYKGNVTDVFVSEYNGKFDKTKVEEHDLDDDMANNGKFYHITLHCRLLRPEHVDALLGSDLVDETVKSVLRRVLRGDIEATKKVKDSDMYTELIPNSIVTESAIFEDLQPVPRYSKLYHGSPAQGIKVLTPQKSRSYPEYGPIVFGSEYPDFVACFGTYWRDDVMRQSSQIKNGKISVILKVVDRRILKDWNKPCSMYELVNDGNFKRLPNHRCEVINTNPVKVKREISFASFWDMIDPYNIEVVDFHTGQKITKDNYASLTESSNSVNHFYFYHLVPKGTKLDNTGITSLQYQYDSGQLDLVKANSDKYRHRLCNGWGIYPNKNPDDLSIDEIMDGLNSFRGDQYGTSRIYAFKYPPFPKMGPKMSDILKDKDIYRIDLDDPSTRRYIKFIDWGHDMSYSSNASLSEEWYRNVSPEEYFSNYTENTKGPLFASLNHIGIVPVKGYLPKTCWTKITFPKNISSITESSNVHELESVDISSRIFHGSPTQNIKEVKAFHNDRIYSDLGPVIFCSEYKNFAGCYGTKWNDKTMKLYTSFDEGKLSAVSIAVLDKEIMNEWNKPCSLYELENDGNFKRLPNHPCEIINPNSVKVKKEIKFNNFYEMIKACNIEVRIGDDNGLVSVATEASARSKLPDSAFGIPEERKYELDTKKHVLSAIKLFNWVEDKYEKELAQNILKKIDEFDIKEDEIHITEKNRFYKYYYKTGDGK